ncbi:hypothetical protein [Pseudomonas viridiflava]|uniref:hypothetical protein n=1 Tax=Pseudomonas viridiflava TaxID=33069 RepID=UPI000F04C194|nr:hypothetical protein [Pseudomonas viridiflava]
MDREQLEANISEDLKLVKGRAVNKNALAALFGAFGGPTAAVASLGKIFFGRDAAIDQAQHKIERGYILDLLCSIDEALTQLKTSAEKSGVKIDGLIDTFAEDSGSVIGVDIGGPQRVDFAPGARIRTEAKNSTSVTGLRINQTKDDL